MRDYRELEEKFLTECKAYLDERADARMAEIVRFESRNDLRRHSYEEAYIEMMKAKCERPAEVEDPIERFMKEQLENEEIQRAEPLALPF